MDSSIDVNPDMDLFPVLSLAERDRRWEVARDLMDEHGVAGLVVFGGGRERLDRYLAKESLRGIVVLPRVGEPVMIASFNATPLLRHDEPGSAVERWIQDLRFGSTTVVLADILRGMGLSSERLGVVGMVSHAPKNAAISYSLWTQVLEATPQVSWLDLSLEFERLLLVKSEEEIIHVRRAARLGEDACRAFLEAAGEGVLESAVGAAATHAIVSQGGHEVEPRMLLRSGSRWIIGPSEWGYAGGQPHRLRKGDVIGSELFACWSGFETQQQMHVAIGDPGSRLLRLAAVAKQANEVGAAMAKPGVMFSDICKAMHEVVLDAGLWSRGPLTQTVGPVLFNGPMVVGAESQPLLKGLPVPPTSPADGDFELQAGMTMAMQCCANEGLYGMCLGGTILIGPDGAEELNTLARDLQIKD